MADNFSVKNYLRENKLGSYRLLQENYVDLKPIGEAPIKPTNIYNAESNGWMDTVDNEKVGKWNVTYGHPGVLSWALDGENFSIYATPKWDGEGTPIQLVNDEHEILGNDAIDQDEFSSFEEYAQTLLPHINRIYGANRSKFGDATLNKFFDDLTVEVFDGFGGVKDLNPISDESPITGKKKVKEAFGKELNFSLDELVAAWDDMYGEDFKEDYSGFYDTVNPNTTFTNVSLTIPKVSKLWKQMYGEDFEYEYPAVVKRLSSLSSMEETSMTAGKDWQYDDDVDSETGVPYTDDDQDRFWDLGGAEVHSGVKSLLDDGFELKDIISFIKSHYSSGRPDTTDIFEAFDNPTGEAPHWSDIEPSGEDEDELPNDRIMGLGGDEISDAVQFLLDDGFDSDEIIEWFSKLVNRLEAGQMPY